MVGRLYGGIQQAFDHFVRDRVWENFGYGLAGVNRS